MTAHRITTAGNARPWKAKGCVDRMSVPGPIVSDDKPIVWGLIVWPVVVGLGIALMGLAT